MGGRVVETRVTEIGLDVDGRQIPWLDIDDLREAEHSLDLVLADGTEIALAKLGASHDRFVTEVRSARRRVRFPALVIAHGEPVRSFVSRTSVVTSDVHLFDDVLVIEPNHGEPTTVPLGYIDEMTRTGPSLELRVTGGGVISVKGMGGSVDEFETRLRDTCAALRQKVAAAYVSLDASLEGCVSDNGRPRTAPEFGGRWSAIEAHVRRGPRASEYEFLSSLEGARTSVGLMLDQGAEPFLFATVEVEGKIVVEGLTADDRATFVFAATNTDELLFHLAVTRFRREVLVQGESDLGQWATAARANSAVRTLREQVLARVVHDTKWTERLAAVLA